MTVKTLGMAALAAIAAIIIIMIILTAIAVIRHKKDPEKKAGKSLRVVLCFCAIAVLACAAGSAYGMLRYNTAKKHGLYSSNITFSQLNTSIENSPEESVLPEDLSGTVVIYYKFGCEDCEAIYPDLKAALGGSAVYWVSTQSEQGKELLKTYPVEDVPSGIYIRQDNYNDSVPFTAKLLYTSDENGNIVLDKQAIERLLYLQSEGR